MITNCYLCGQSIQDQNDLSVDVSKEGFERIHHKHCSQVYYRLKSIYGDNFNDLGLDRVKWGSGTNTGDLLELSLYDIRNSGFSQSEIIHSVELFKKTFVDECYNAKNEIVILFSNTKFLQVFGSLLESILFTHDQTKTKVKKVRILGVKSNILTSFLENKNWVNIENVSINFIDSNKNAYFLAIVDQSKTFLSELYVNNSGNNSEFETFSNIVSVKDSVTLHAAAAFESLWKQSLLEERIKSLSLQLKNNDIPNSNFVRILAHELKNPIQPILGFSDMIQNNTRLNSDQKNDLLKIIARNARKLDIMTNNILDYARMENNNFELNYELFNLVDVLKELISDYSIQINRKKIEIKLSYVDGPILINADKVRMVEVFDNLLSNAIKFTEKGHIDIIVEKLERSVRITVRDSGMGISNENLDKLFSRFFTTDKLGTGLGLYISKIIVIKHSGTIEAKNNSDSQGSNFSVVLPT